MNRRGVYSIVLLLVPLAGCGGPGGEAEVAPPRSEVEQGPVRVSVQVDPARPSLSDRPTMTLTVNHAPGVTIEIPPFGEAIGDFAIVDSREALPRVDEDREILERVFTLEPTRPGKLEIWPIPVNYTDARPDGDGKTHSLETQRLTVDVGSVLASETPNLAELRPAVGPLGLPFSHVVALGWTAAILLAAVVAALVWRRRRQRHKAIAERPLTAAERAYLELQRIVDEGLARRDVKQFYFELTGVVRRFIERTTRIRAPEQTTEEFLREITVRETFPPDENRRLKNFLEAADLVKFAAHQPRDEDVDASVDRARDFIGRHDDRQSDQKTQETEVAAC